MELPGAARLPVETAACQDGPVERALSHKRPGGFNFDISSVLFRGGCVHRGGGYYWGLRVIRTHVMIIRTHFMTIRTPML